MIFSAHQPQYLPWIGFFHKVMHSDIFVFLDDVQFKKREFQNRNRIRTKDGWIWLTVPVLTKNKYYQKLNEVRINNSYDWRKEHWKSILISYSSAEYFKKYSDFFESVYKMEWEKLLDLNLFIINYIFKVIKIDVKTYLSSEFNICKTGTERIIEIAKILKGDTYLSGVGGIDYLEEHRFSEEGIKLVYQFFPHPVYKQQFNGFQPYMSIIDLLFNCGEKSIDVIRNV